MLVFPRPQGRSTRAGCALRAMEMIAGHIPRLLNKKFIRICDGAELPDQRTVNRCCWLNISSQSGSSALLLLPTGVTVDPRCLRAPIAAAGRRSLDRSRSWTHQAAKFRRIDW